MRWKMCAKCPFCPGEDDLKENLAFKTNMQSMSNISDVKSQHISRHTTVSSLTITTICMGVLEFRFNGWFPGNTAWFP